MGASPLPVILITIFWGLVGIVAPIILPKGPNRQLVQVILSLSGATCWLFWLCCYMHQMNPLIGPSLHNRTLIAVQNIWDD